MKILIAYKDFPLIILFSQAEGITYSLGNFLNVYGCFETYECRNRIIILLKKKCSGLQISKPEAVNIRIAKSPRYEKNIKKSHQYL